MDKLFLAAVAGLAMTTAAVAGPFDQFRGKMKDGLYEYKMDMDMGAIPGMPPGMGKQSRTFQHCVTPEDINSGQMGREKGKMPQECEVKNFKMSGNTANYRMECKGEHPMTADTRITFKGDGYDMDTKMTMDQGSGPMNMSQHMEAKYLGACKK